MNGTTLLVVMYCSSLMLKKKKKNIYIYIYFLFLSLSRRSTTKVVTHIRSTTHHLIRSTHFDSDNQQTKKTIKLKYCNTKPFAQNQPQAFRNTTNSHQKPQLKDPVNLTPWTVHHGHQYHHAPPSQSTYSKIDDGFTGHGGREEVRGRERGLVVIEEERKLRWSWRKSEK